MTPREFKDMPAIDHLRLMVQNFGSISEAFNRRFSFAQLLALHKAWMLSEWDVFPDKWTPRQVREALLGVPPRWDDEERPVYGKRPRALRRGTPVKVVVELAAPGRGGP